VPERYFDAALSLEGKNLAVAGNEMLVGAVEKRSLSTITTIYSRYLVFSNDPQAEEQFMDNAMQALQAMSVRPEKMLPGREKTIQMPGKMLKTRSLMITGITVEESLRIQQQGLGLHQHLGCGIFLPHKGIEEVGKSTV
jgi:CRISPR-associated protein Cas6